MNSGLRNALVYLGLAKPVQPVDPEVGTAPMSTSRVVALAAACVSGWVSPSLCCGSSGGRRVVT
jgi:hypothetical protein